MTEPFLAQLRLAYNKAYKVYEEAIAARESVDLLLDMVPLDEKELYKAVQQMQENCVQTINRAWDAKASLDTLMTTNTTKKREKEHD